MAPSKTSDVGDARSSASFFGLKYPFRPPPSARSKRRREPNLVAGLKVLSSSAGTALYALPLDPGVSLFFFSLLWWGRRPTSVAAEARPSCCRQCGGLNKSVLYSPAFGTFLSAT